MFGDNNGIAVRIPKREFAAPVPIDFGSPFKGYLFSERGVNGARIVGIDRNSSESATITLLRYIELEDRVVAFKYDERRLVSGLRTARFEIQY